MKRIRLFCFLLLSVSVTMTAQSVYRERPVDAQAHYFAPQLFTHDADEIPDVSDALQDAINKLKRENNFGILFIPEGRYRISRTIYIPKAIRLIGYGKSRPEFVLGAATPGYQNEPNFMFWFTSELVEAGDTPKDANPGTFYSAISNLDFRIEDGNPQAIAVRSRFAQHSFVSHCNFYIGDGYAGIFDLGNEVENLKFFGGECGITSGRTSPRWPMMLVDLYFEGQRRAAILSRNTGMAIVSMHVNDSPVAIELEEGVSDRLFLEDCFFENVGRGVMVGVENQTGSQINLVNVRCENVEVPVYFSPSDKSFYGEGDSYLVRNFVHGLVMDDLADDSHYETVFEVVPINGGPSRLDRVIPSLPPMESWVDIKNFGAVGDGITDDTRAIQSALAQHPNIYFPTGLYRVTETLKLSKGSKLVGLHPYATQILIHESEPAFSGFGAPVPLVESSAGGSDIINGIGLNTGAYNNRAVGLKWMAGEHSLINDIKFVGGHGNMPKPGEPDYRRSRDTRISTPVEPVHARGLDLAWDNQYWSLWVTNHGGGTLKNIWTANTYASAGLYISHTATLGKVFAMSIEHHVRQEARLNHVANWKFYAFQFEEEGLEGERSQALDVNDCQNLMFANFWMYRTIRVNVPRPWGIKVSNSRNIDFRNMRSWTQVLQLPERTIFDMDKQLAVYPGDFARVQVTGGERPLRKTSPGHHPDPLGFGYEFATGATSDSKGNVYFCDNQLKRIYKWSAATGTLAIYADFPFKPFSLAVDTRDNLIVVCRYDHQPGLADRDPPANIETLPDNNWLYSSWGNGGWAVQAYAISPKGGDNMQVLALRETSEIREVQRVIHPTHRWRQDFAAVVTQLAESSFVAPDGVTLIPNTFDLGRSVQLMAVSPNQSQPVYVTHEDPKITYRFQVGERGQLTGMTPFVSRGEYGNLTDGEGTLYLAEGQILTFDRESNEMRRITLPGRVHSMTWGGNKNQELFVTTSSGLYRVDPAASLNAGDPH